MKTPNVENVCFPMVGAVPDEITARMDAMGELYDLAETFSSMECDEYYRAASIACLLKMKAQIDIIVTPLKLTATPARKARKPRKVVRKKLRIAKTPAKAV